MLVAHIVVVQSVSVRYRYEANPAEVKESAEEMNFVNTETHHTTIISIWHAVEGGARLSVSASCLYAGQTAMAVLIHRSPRQLRVLPSLARQQSQSAAGETRDYGP